MSAPKTPDQARSKILRLPFADRMEFNRLVRDGYSGPHLIKWLAAHGVPSVNGENLRKYKHSAGYRAWLEEESGLEKERAATEQMMRLVDAMGGSASEKIKSIVAGKLLQIMQGVNDAEDLKQVVSAFSAVTQAESLGVDRQRLAQRERLVQLKEAEFQNKTCEQFLIWIKDQFAQQIAASSMDNGAKIAALREHYYADVDAMIKSGKVVLPA